MFCACYMSAPRSCGWKETMKVGEQRAMCRSRSPLFGENIHMHCVSPKARAGCNGLSSIACQCWIVRSSAKETYHCCQVLMRPAPLRCQDSDREAEFFASQRRRVAVLVRMNCATAGRLRLQGWSLSAWRSSLTQRARAPVRELTQRKALTW